MVTYCYLLQHFWGRVCHVIFTSIVCAGWQGPGFRPEESEVCHRGLACVGSVPKPQAASHQKKQTASHQSPAQMTASRRYWSAATGKPGVNTSNPGAGQMAQPLRALTALSKVLSSNPSNHMVAYNHP